MMGFILRFSIVGVLIFASLPLFGQDSKSSLQQGVDAYHRGDYDLAIACYTEAIRLNPQGAGAYQDRGVAYFKKGDFDQAIADYNQAIQLNLSDEGAYSNRGNVYAAQGNLDKAMADYDRAIEMNPKDATAFNNRGNAFLTKADYDKAIADFNTSLQLNPQYANAYDNRGKAYLAKGDYDNAIADLSNAIRLSPKSPIPHNNRGKAYHAKGNDNDAMADYNQAILLDPKFTEAYVNRGLINQAHGDYDKAIADDDQALQLDPANTSAQNNRKVALDLQKGNPPTAASTPGPVPVPAPAQASSPGDGEMPGKWTVSGQELTLKEQKSTADGGFIAEYIPEQNSWDDWETLFAVRFLPGINLDARAITQQKELYIFSLKGSQPLSRVARWDDPDGRSTLIDFTECSQNFDADARMGFMEWNLWRYVKFENGIVAYQMARRVYPGKGAGEDVGAFTKGVEAGRDALVAEIHNSQLPVPKAAGNVPAPEPPLLSVPFKLGDDIATVKAALHTNLDPIPFSVPNFPGVQAQKSSSLHIETKGIWAFFNSQDQVEQIRFDAPFGGSFLGIQIGDSVTKVTSALGQPLKAPWLILDRHAYLYVLDEKTRVRFDLSDVGGVQSILLLSSSSPSAPAANSPKTGTGAFITTDGMVLTAAHVVAGATHFEIVSTMGKFPAVPVKFDPGNDVAILKCAVTGAPALPIIHSQEVRLGQGVFTIGFPNPNIQGYDPKFTEGEISSANGLEGDPRRWQISVPLQPGNSGGPLCDENGNIVGIVVAGLNSLVMAKLTGSIAQNVNYAVKSDYIFPLLEGFVDRPAKRDPIFSRKKEDVVEAARAGTVLIIAY